MTTTHETDPQGAAKCPVKNLDYRAFGPVGSHHATYDALRDEHPWFRNEMEPGFWTMMDHEGILEVLQNPEIFSSSVVTVFDPEPKFKWIPEMLDGEEHFKWRKLLGPLFSPKQVENLETKVRDRARELVEQIQPLGKCDFMAAFAHQFPTSIFLELMGMPVEELPTFLKWEYDLLQSPLATPEDVQARLDAMTMIQARFKDLIGERKAEPRDDILSQAIGFQIDGEPVAESDLLSFCLFLFMAGLDTVSVTLSWSYWHLSNHPEDRRRVATEPEVIPHAIEEFLRAYSSVIAARKATTDHEVRGCPIKAGDLVALPLNGSTRDEAAFENAKEVIIDRFPNNHIAFGAGPHRCLGSHLARRELKIALEEWHKLIPEYRLVEGSVPDETGRLIGLTTLPLEWDV